MLPQKLESTRTMSSSAPGKHDMDQRWRTLGIVVFTAAIFGGAALRSAEAKILAQWVQLGADGGSSVRAIADDACPSVIFDGIAVSMIVRSAPAQKLAGVKPAQFSVLGCEVAVPAGSVAAVLDGKPLPLARPNPQRIVIFGDSGCRLFNGATAQACKRSEFLAVSENCTGRGSLPP